MKLESLIDVAPTRVPLALARLHRATPLAASLALALDAGAWGEVRLRDVIEGAGFEIDTAGRRDAVVEVRATRARKLPDTVGPRMRVLVIGLNPSLYTADAGIGFARPGNRFWPAALASGLVTVERDPLDALVHHRVGMTNLALRATAKASELADDEYVAGIPRLERMVAWLRPRTTCFVGLSGWRVAIDKKAAPGVQPAGFAGVPAYLMPNTSGLNTHAQLPDFVDHLRAAAALADAR